MTYFAMQIFNHSERNLIDKLLSENLYFRFVVCFITKLFVFLLFLTISFYEMFV